MFTRGCKGEVVAILECSVVGNAAFKARNTITVIRLLEIYKLSDDFRNNALDRVAGER